MVENLKSNGQYQKELMLVMSDPNNVNCVLSVKEKFNILGFPNLYNLLTLSLPRVFFFFNFWICKKIMLSLLRFKGEKENKSENKKVKQEIKVGVKIPP